MNLISNTLLTKGLDRAISILKKFASQANFIQYLHTAFGDEFDESIGLGIGSQFQSGDFRLLPDIQVLSRGELGAANGAYAGDLDKIFVSGDFLAQHQGDVNAVSELLLEEIGHKLDRLLNGNVDSSGDEGAIFRLLVTGQTIAANTLAGLKRQDDHTVITVNGQAVAIEKQDFTGTTGSDTFVGTAGDDTFITRTGHDSVDGGVGTDTLIVDYSANTNDFYYSQKQGITSTLANGAGNITAYSSGSGAYDQVAFSGIEQFNITGTRYNDNLLGGRGNDTINAGAGDDTVNAGGGGIDILDGGAGTDSVNIDVSSSNGSNNFALLDSTLGALANGSTVINFEQISLTTGVGDDTIVGGNLSDTINSGAGNDSISVGLGHDSVDGGVGTDTLIVDYSANTNDFYYSQKQGITSNLANGAGNITAYSSGSGAYDQVAFSGIEQFNITGTRYNDNLLGGAGNNTLSGGAGDDNIIGGTGNDTLLGGTGSDTLTSDGGVDIIDGGAGIDFAAGVDVSSSSGDNNVDVNRSTNVLANGTQLIGIEGFNLTTGVGNDTIVAGNLSDTINSGAGDDSISVGLGHDSVDGGMGTDTLIVDYSANINDFYYSQKQGITSTLANGAGNITAYSSGYRVYDQVAFSGIEQFNITGTRYNDNLLGGRGNDTINAGTGDDTVNAGGGGVDILDGGAGTDFANNVDVSSSSGNNNFSLLDSTLGALANGSTVINFEQISLTTGEGNDTIVGGNLSDAINAGAGDDVINAGLGINSVDGSAGSDTLILDYSANANDFYYSQKQGITSTLVDGAGSITAYSSGYRAYDQVNFSNIEKFNITGTQYNDNLIGGAGNDTINAGAGDDTVTSGGGIDALDGGAGTDSVNIDVSSSNGSNNFALLDSTLGALANGSTVINFEQISLTTGVGDDTIVGGNLSDTINSGAGDDVINAGLGINSVDGSVGSDTLILDYSANSNDFYYSQKQGITSTLADGAGSITAYSSGYRAYDQVNFSNIEKFNITGTQYNDNLIGGAGNDTINAGAGDDTVTSGGGIDALDGGAGTDSVNIDVSSSNGSNNFALLDSTLGALANGSTVINFEQISLTTGVGDDTIVGGNLSDTINSGAGDDVINAGLGINSVDGSVGSDTLILDYSANSNDFYYSQKQGITSTLADGAGSITAYSSGYRAYDQVNFSNIEKFNITGTQYNDNLIGGAGKDTINAGAGDDTVTSGGGIDALDGGAGTDSVNIDVSSSNGSNNFALLDSTLGALANGSTVINFEQISLTTGVGDDTIVGGNLSDTINSGAGNDSISVGLGHDSVDGGVGTDTLIVDYSANTNDFYYSQKQGITSTLANGAGNITAYSSGYRVYEQVAFSGIEQFNITGTRYNDNLIGGAGNDTFKGGAGSDILTGGAGDDLYLINANFDGGNDTIVEAVNGGTDTLSFKSTIIAPININLSQTTTQTVATNVYVNGNLNNIENAIGGTGSDNISGNALNNVLDGGTGDDILNGTDRSSISPGRGEKDTLTGGAGADTFVLGDSTRVYYATTGNSDYATITDFNPLEDKVQLNGASGNYFLTVDGNNTKLYLNNFGNSPDELISVIQNVTGLSLTSGAFTYVNSQTGTAIPVDQNKYALSITGLPYGSVGSNQGQATVVITGQNFSPTDQFTLIANDGTTKVASKVSWVNNTESWATFDLQGLTAGTYSLLTQNGGNVAGASNAFTVTNGSVGNIQTTLTYPTIGVVTVKFSNIGQTDIAAPLFKINTTNAHITDRGSSLTSPSFAQLLNLSFGSSPTGPAGILAPGKGGTASFTYAPDGDGLINVTVEQVNPTDVIDWAPIKAQLYTNPIYSSINSQAWDAIWTNFTNSVGNTYGSLQTALDLDANYLSQIGFSSNISQLLQFELEKASNSLTNPTIASANDAFARAPEISLTFGRTFSNSLADKDKVGVLGLGWSNSWDIHYSADASGNVTLDANGGQRLFTKQSNGTYQGQRGDYGQLSLSQGKYVLQEKSGNIYAFRSDNQQLDYIQVANNHRITADYAGTQLTSLLHSSGENLALSYNPQGRLSSIVDSLGQTTTYTYDPSGQHLLAVTTPQGTTSYTYDNGSNPVVQNSLLSIANPDGTHQYFSYDPQGRISQQSGDGGVGQVSYTYDRGGMVQITDALNNTSSVLFDPNGQAVQIQDKLGNATGVNRSSYTIDSIDGIFTKTTVTAPGGLTSTYQSDNQGNVVDISEPLNHLSLGYTSSSNKLQTFANTFGNNTGYTYDSAGNLTKTTYADGTSESYSHDAQGNVTQSIDRQGNATNHTYNAQGLLLSSTFIDGSTFSYTYNRFGNLTSATDASGTISLSYDAANRLTQIAYPNGKSLSYTYNAGGQRTSMVDQSGFTTNYSYTAAGQLAGTTDAQGQAIVTYTYDLTGQMIKEVNGNGTYTTHQYDAGGQLTHLTNYAADQTINSRFDYTYNKLGLQTSATSLDGSTWTYQYDDGSQLTRAVLASKNASIANQDLTYKYDIAGNRSQTIENGITTNSQSNNVSEAFRSNGIGGNLDVYDANGNLISQGSAGAKTTYTYNAQNRLTGVTDPSGNTWSYTYNALGNRISSTHNGQKTTYLVDPTGLGNVVGQYDASGNTIANYTYGLGLTSQVSGSNTSYYDFNAQGSTVGLTGASGGSYLNSYSYSPFGKVISATGTVANPFQFVGQFGVSNQGNGLYSMRAREYDPTVGRFTQPDPIGLNGGDANLYRYVGNSPTNFIDPSGLSNTSWADAVQQSGSKKNNDEVAKQNNFFEKLFPKDPDRLEHPKFNELCGTASKFGRTTCSPLEDYIKNHPPASPEPPNPTSPSNPPTSAAWGDVHLITLDGIRYDFQGAGEYTLLKSTTDDFEIQTRQEPWVGNPSATINTAVAVKLGGQKIGFYLRDANPVKVNGTAVNIPDGAIYAAGQNLISRKGNTYTVFSANGDAVEIALSGGVCINIALTLANNRKGNVVGLLGNYNGQANDDFARRDGTAIGGSIGYQELYGDYGNSWRITQATSLFDYATVQNTNTFTNLTPPPTVTLDPQAVALARQTAINAGITDPALLENAIYDLAVTNNNTGFLQGYTAQQQATNLTNPNTTTAPNGYGTQHWIAGTAALPYTLNFSNNALQGTNPVAQVTITEKLDPNLDLTTFQLGNFSFAGNIYTVPSGVQTYTQQIDLTATKGIVVNVTAGLDTTTGTVTWTFTSIDPATGKAITNPTQGFLPAEDLTGAGSGNVGYTIQPKASLTDGTVIKAQSSITFDKKPPVQTAEVFNTIQQNAPTSEIDPLPAVASSPNFTVAWTGSTANSGAAYYNVYVSTNNGEYVLWQKATVATSATYNGQAGNTYAFYSVATDRAGLTETTHAAAKVTTVVVAPTLALANDTGTSSTDGLTNSGVVTVTDIQTGASGQYSLDAGNNWTAFTGNSFTLTDDGAKSVIVRQTDLAGNVSTSSTALSFALDTTTISPTLTLVVDSGSSQSDGITSSGLVTVTGLEPGATSQYSLDDGTNWTAFTGTSFTLTGDGAKSVIIRQTDLAGNVSSSSTAVNFTLDTTAIVPTLTLELDSGSSSSDGITNSGVVTVTGLEPDATSQYSVDDGINWTTFTGNSFTLTGDDAKSVTVRQTDLAGNVSSSSTALSFALDTIAIAPTLNLALDSGSSQSDGITSSGLVTVTGLEPGATSQYSLDDGTNWTAFTGNNFTLTGDGAKSVIVRQTDLAGNVSSSSTSVNFTLDTTAISPILTLELDSGSSQDDGITNSGVVTVTGLEPDATSQYSVDNGINWTAFTGNSFTLTGDDAKSVTVRQTDLAGNVSSGSTPLNFTLDTAAPVVPTISLTKDTATNSGIINVSGLEPTGTSQYSLDAGTTWTTFTGNSFILTGAGAKSVVVHQTDLAGNVSSSSTALNFTLDPISTVPTLKLANDTGNSSTDGITNFGIVNVTGLTSGSTRQYSLNGKTWTAFTGSSFTLTGDGKKSVTVRQTDLAGNVTSSTPFSFTLDTVAPNAPTLKLAKDDDSRPSDKITNAGVVNVSKLETGATSQYSLDSGSTWTTITGTSFTLTGDGPKSVVVRQTDLAGNISTSSSPLSFTLDTTVIAPTLALAADTGISYTDGITNSGVVNITGLETGATSQYSLNGGNTWTKINGSSFKLTDDGAKSVTVRQTDLAGNVSTNLVPLSFTLDTKASTAPTISSITADALITLNGTAEANSTISIYQKSSGSSQQIVGTATTNSQGVWNFTTQTIPPGKSSFKAKATDAAGNLSSFSRAAKLNIGTNGNDTLTATANDDTEYGLDSSDKLVGGAGNDTLIGGAGNDKLIGGTGNNTLTGGTGNDVFVLSNKLIQQLISGVDTITDFTVGQDQIQLSKLAFKSSVTGAANSLVLAASDFSTVTTDAAAAIAATALVYNSVDGKLFYNPNLTATGFGSNGGQFAELTAGLNLTYNDFTVTA